MFIICWWENPYDLSHVAGNPYSICFYQEYYVAGGIHMTATSFLPNTILKVMRALMIIDY